MAEKWINMSVTKVKPVIDDLKKLNVEIDRALAEALFTTAHHIAGQADELVPVDTGALKSSQDVSHPKGTSKTMNSRITYGGPSAAYALEVHENLAMNHPRGGQAKYLEEPFLKETADWPEPIATRLKIAGLSN